MLSIIIVEPEGDQNLGMIARAMANTGQSRLTLVNPRCDHLSEGAQRFAIHAFPLLQNASIVPDLKAALEGIDLSVAITRREGDKRRLDLDAPGLAQFLAPYQDQHVALVFGREQTGLSNDEVFLCNLCCAIPSDEVFPSLNLAQAVMVILYELYKTKHPVDINPASSGEFSDMMDSLSSCLHSMDYFKKTDPAGLLYVWQKILHRARLDSKDTHVIKNMFSRIEGMFRKKG